MYFPLKLAILARWLQSVSPGANTSVAALLADASAGCIACPPGAQLGPIRLALICGATGGSGPPVPIPPPTPTDFNIDNTSLTDSIDLSWSESGSPDFIEIWRSLNGGAFVLRATIAGGILAFNDNDIQTPGDLIEYKILANTIAGGDSPFTVVRGALYQRNGSAAVGALSYATVQAIVTDYTLLLAGGVTSLSFPTLQYCVDVGLFVINNCAVLISISAPVLVSGNGIDIDPVPALTTLDLTMLGSLTADFILGNSAVVSLALPALQSIGTNFACVSNSALTSISAPLLAHVGGNMQIDTNPLLTSVNFTSLIDVGDFNLSAPILATLSLPALTTVTLGLQITGASLTSFSAPNLTVVPNGVGLTTAALTALNLSSLAVAGNFSLAASNLATLSLPALNQLNLSDFSAESSPSLTTISLPVLTMIAGNVNCSTGNGAIANVSVPNWVITDVTTINFVGNALTVASVEAILARGVASAVTACDFELQGGTNAGFAALSPAGQADFLTLTTAGNTVNINP